MSVRELPAGVHFASRDSKMTQLPRGLFIEYDGNWTDRMQELKDFLVKYYHICPEDSQYLFDNHMPYAEKLKRCLNLLERPLNTEAKSQDAD